MDLLPQVNHMRLHRLLPLLGLAVTACRVVPASPDDSDGQRTTEAVASGDTLRLAVGQRGKVPGTLLEVTLVDVPTDSRCPANALVLCAWAGDATVRLRGVTDTADQIVTLHTGVEPRRAQIDGHVLELVDLLPGNGLEERPRTEEYRAVVRVWTGAVEPPIQGTLGDTVRIPVGQLAEFAGGALRVAFLVKDSESRCPANAMCVHVGDASALLRIEGAGTSIERSLHTHAEPRAAAHAGFKVHLANIEPYPGTEPPNVRMMPVAVVIATRQ